MWSVSKERAEAKIIVSVDKISLTMKTVITNDVSPKRRGESKKAKSCLQQRPDSANRSFLGWIHFILFVDPLIVADTHSCRRSLHCLVSHCIKASLSTCS